MNFVPTVSCFEDWERMLACARAFRIPTRINALILERNSPQYAALARKIEEFSLVATFSLVKAVSREACGSTTDMP